MRAFEFDGLESAKRGDRNRSRGWVWDVRWRVEDLYRVEGEEGRGREKELVEVSFWACVKRLEMEKERKRERCSNDSSRRVCDFQCIPYSAEEMGYYVLPPGRQTENERARKRKCVIESLNQTHLCFHISKLFY